MQIPLLMVLLFLSCVSAQKAELHIYNSDNSTDFKILNGTVHFGRHAILFKPFNILKSESDHEQTFNEFKIKLYSMCMDVVDAAKTGNSITEMIKNYVNNICEYSSYKSINLLCKYFSDFIIDDIHNMFIPDQINAEMCEMILN